MLKMGAKSDIERRGGAKSDVKFEGLDQISKWGEEISLN